MAKFQLPSAERVRQLVRLSDDKTGLIWLPRRPSDFPEGPRQETQCKIWNTRYAGKPALNSPDKHGYKVGCMDNYPVKAHRVMWVYVNGVWPDGDIDHINGDRSDNRIENLRTVSHAENMRNRGLPANARGVDTGIKKDPTSNSYIVKVGKKLHVGRWPTIEEARAARHAALKVLGYHENHFKRPSRPVQSL